MLERARAFFDRREVLEVDTPALSRYAASDPQIDGHRVIGAGAQTLYLQTSPESCMKRMLADGYPDIYAICHVFRDGETGRLHQPEFTMVEWYRHNFGLYAMAAETVAFVADLLGRAALRDVETFDYVAPSKSLQRSTRSRRQSRQLPMPQTQIRPCERASAMTGMPGMLALIHS